MKNLKSGHVVKAVRPLPVDLRDPSDEGRQVVYKVNASTQVGRQALCNFSSEGDRELPLPERTGDECAIIPNKARKRGMGLESQFDSEATVRWSVVGQLTAPELTIKEIDQVIFELFGLDVSSSFTILLNLPLNIIRRGRSEHRPIPPGPVSGSTVPR